MKDQLKNQSTSEKFQHEALLMGDHQLQNQDNNVSATFKSTDTMKRNLPAGMQKKINPRLLIL